MHGRRERRDEVRQLLTRFDLDAIARWASSAPQSFSVLQSLLLDPDELVSWRAVEAVGRVAAIHAHRDPERVRELLRRTLWLMNDESGGVLWHGPQVMGAVLAHVPDLRAEFLDVLASFLEEEPFRSGTRWGLWRVAAASPAVVAPLASRLAPSLADADPSVRGHASLALYAACGPSATTDVAGDLAPLVVFDFRAGALRSTTVRDAARGAG